MFSSIKSILILSGLLTTAAGGHAAESCSLQGDYAFKAHGAVVGVFDSAGALHAYASPQLVTSVGQFSFDGNGSFTRVDFAMNNGVAAGSPIPLTATGFRTGQTGSYTLSEDCTGIISLSVPGGTTIDFAVSLVDYGLGAYGVVKQEFIPSMPAANVPAGASCDAGTGCNVGVNLLIELTKDMPRRH